MVQQKNKMNFNDIFKYVLFLFMLICTGFVCNSIKVEAKDDGPVIIIPNDYKLDDGDLKVYIGYDENNFNYIKYGFTSSSIDNSIDINSGTTSYSNGLTKKQICDKYNGGTCAQILREYTIPKSSITNVFKPNSTYDGTKTGVVVLYIEADNVKKAIGFIPLGGGKTNKNGDLSLDVVAPSVTSVDLAIVNDSSSRTLRIGDTIKFTINFNEEIFNKVSVLKFKIGESSRSVTCNNNLYSIRSYIECSYTIASGDEGNFSVTSISNNNQIKDRYNNKIRGNIDVSNIAINKNFKVDGLKPVISRLEVVKGIYSITNPLLIKMVFSEDINAIKNDLPVITIDDYATCTYSSSSSNAIIYSCRVRSIEKNGYVSSAKVNYDYSYIYDLNGNILDAIKNATYEFTVVDNNGDVLEDKGVHINSKDPDLNFESITYKVTRDGILTSSKYVKKGDNINIVIPVKDGISVSSADINKIKVTFGNVSASPVISFMASNLVIDITVLESYNGKLNINFDGFVITGENGLDKIVNYNIDLELYSDNKNPIFSSENIVIENGKEIDNIIYSGDSTKITFELLIEDISELTYDLSKVYIKSGTQIISVSKENISLENNKLIVNITSDVLAGLNSFSLVIEKGFAKDVFENEFAQDYVQSYTLDDSNPNINMNFNYPLYKGISSNDKNYLVSGNKIDVELSSNDKDLESYCLSNTSSECSEWKSIEENTKFAYSLPSDLENGTYNIYLCIRDYALNITCVNKSLEVNMAFDYKSGKEVRKNHSVEVNAFMFEDGTDFYYKWIKEGNSVNNFTNVIKKNSSSILIEGNVNLNGSYMLCVKQNDKVICGDYLKFDNDIDEFNVAFMVDGVQVDASNAYTNDVISTLIEFNDISTIKCVAVGKNVSNVNCERGKNNVTYYDGSDFGSPISAYAISENGEYTFYIEDIIGNFKKLTYVIESIDREEISINVYKENGESNLENDVYKNEHRFKVMFDEKETTGSKHARYSYFFTTKKYSVDRSNNISVFYSEENFNNYFYSSDTTISRNITDNSILSSKQLIITSPNSTGKYNLYIRAIDSANNVSYAYVEDIFVDKEAPAIAMRDGEGNITNGNSSEYITNFTYQVEISDVLSFINIDEIYYEFVVYDTNVSVQRVKYESCNLGSNLCVIDKVQIDSSKFENGVAYKFKVYAKDSAGNSATYSSNKLYIRIPTLAVTSSFDQNKFTNNRNISFSVTHSNSYEDIERVAYCLNNCSYVNKELSSGFVNLDVSSSNSYSLSDLSLIEGENSLYVYAIDVYGNDKLEIIKIYYDSINPIINNESVTLYTNNSNNLYITIEDGKKIYNYSNETQIKLKFVQNSLFDIANGNNSNLKAYVCFKSSCNSYNISSYLKDGYYVNRELSISSPINFTGVISYYLYDEAGNASETYAFNVRYSASVGEIRVNIYDSNNNLIDESKKYNKIILNIENSNVNYLIEKGYIQYALVSKNINLEQEKENYSGTISNFLNYYGFNKLSINNQIISKNNVDDSYYLWIYVRNEIGNYILKKIDKNINMDTISPSFDEIIIDTIKNSDNTYSLIMYSELVEELYININGSYEKVEFTSNNGEYVYTFNRNDTSAMFVLKLVDEAKNESIRNYDYSSITSSVSAKAYFNAKNKNIKVVINNLGSKSVTRFIYVVDDNITSTQTYDIDTIESCGVSVSSICKSESYSVSNNVYTISINEDKKITFFVYVDNNLIDLVEVVTRFDDEAPSVYYSLKNSSGNYNSNYTLISGDLVYVSSSIKVKMTDNKQINYFELYDFENNTLLSTCYFNDSASDYNCNRDNIEINGNTLFYRLETGNYILKVYDISNNEKEVKIITDMVSPVINVYKKINDTYYYQAVVANIYGSLEGLYISVSEENFSVIDIIVSNGSNKTYLNYSYMSNIGKCLVNRSICEYGVSILDLINSSAEEYDKITIKVTDKANRVAETIINYDSKIPNIYIDDIEGNIITLGNSSYTIKNEALNVEIGKDNIDLGDLLRALNLNINGMNYNDLVNDSKLKVDVYSGENLYSSNLFDSIGNYTIKINYTSISLNKAEEKIFKVNVVDTLAPELRIITNVNNVELNEKVEILGVEAIDNYAMENISGTLVKNKIYSLDKAVCSGKYCLNIVKVSDNIYKFSKPGVYKFTYTVYDASNNEAAIEQTITVSDNKAPVITSAYGDTNSFEVIVGNRNALGQVTIPTQTLKKPSSYDEGEDKFIDVLFAGVYVSNNIGTKAKSNETHLVSEDANGLKFKFTKVGNYYIRFTATDSTNHMSTFEYEVKVIDNTKPEIKGINENTVIELDLDYNFDVVRDIIDKYNVYAVDNYYSDVNITYEIKDNNIYDYEVVLIAKDLSLNETRISIYVRFVDTTKPVAGELVLPESTNSTSIAIAIVGGDDNSSNWWHEYSVQNGDWIRYTENSKLEFGNNLNSEVRVCIRAVDSYQNISDNISCKTIIVDTSNPIISGVDNNEIVETEVEVNVTDNSLASVKIWLNNELLDLTKEDLPCKLSKNGTYRIEALDSYGNTTIVDFVINTNKYVNVVNDIKDKDSITTSVSFDKRLLVKVNTEYDANGYINVNTDLSVLNITSKDIVYVLGLVPNTENVFVMYSMSGKDVAGANKITLISNGEKFIDGYKSMDYFLNFNESYYAYVIVKTDVNEPTIIDKEDKKSEKNGALGTVLIITGALATLFLGYQIIRLRRRVRAA